MNTGIYGNNTTTQLQSNRSNSNQRVPECTIAIKCRGKVFDGEYFVNMEIMYLWRYIYLTSRIC